MTEPQRNNERRTANDAGPQSDRESQSNRAPGGKNPRGRDPNKPKVARKASPEYLRKAGLYYLERYNATRKTLRDVLMRRVRRSLQAHPIDERHNSEVLHAAVDTLVTEFAAAKYVDDAAFARGRVRSLQRSGDSPRLIAQKLGMKGVDEQDIRAALDLLADEQNLEEPGALALDSAWRYARRRRLGPYRLDPQAREDQRDKDLAKLARRGFSLDTARRVIEGSLDEAPL